MFWINAKDKEGRRKLERNRETIVVEHDCVVNNDQLFALEGDANDNSVNSRCAEVALFSDFSGTLGK